MKTYAKNAAMTLATVLIGIYILRQIGPTKTLVDKALAG